jgi:broad specificity phosphatase PhoE
MRYILFSLALIGSATAAAIELDIWTQLRQGGHVILLRHAEVDSDSQSTAPNEAALGCAGQPNLNVKGIAQAKQLGQVMRKQRIPIGGVLASPLCRTRDTARIAFGAYRVWPHLEESALSDQAERIAAVSRVIGAHKGPENLVLVTHQPIIDALTLELVDWGTMVIVKPDGKGGINVVKQLPPVAWQTAR